MRAVQAGAPLDAEFATMMDECVQCRACEPVCPSFVPFGHLMEGARAALTRAGAGRSRRRRLAEWVAYRVVLPRQRWLRIVTGLVWLAQRLRIAPRRGRFALPELTLRGLAPLRPTTRSGEPVVLFTGCVMDAWMRDIHRDAISVIEAAGGAVALPGREAACCGALHLHAGRTDEARALARRVMAAMPGEGPIVVDSAGCGAALKDYGRLLGSAEARAFSARVADLHEWLAGRSMALRPGGGPVVIQDPCHLRNVQRVEGAVRTVLAPAFELIEPADDGLCCGAGGSYAVLQPELATAIRDRKVEALRAAGGGDVVVASGNPGCILHLRAGGVDARHPAELLAAALAGSAADPAGPVALAGRPRAENEEEDDVG